jgi:hypothetical protein
MYLYTLNHKIFQTIFQRIVSYTELFRSEISFYGKSSDLTRVYACQLPTQNSVNKLILPYCVTTENDR